MDSIMIIDNTEEAKMEFAKYGWGQSEDILTMEHIQALLELAGKAIAYRDGDVIQQTSS
jgi:hypothetical protein